MHVLAQVAGALREAHGLGLIHRDIKPSNIILCDQGGVPDVAKVVDFGLVKNLDAGADVTLTNPALITGTPLYMAPEALTDPDSVDGRSDLYSLGAVAYYLVTGTHVFGGKTLVEICAHHLNAAPEPLSTRLGAPVPQDLERLVLDCLAKDRSQRPRDAAELIERLAGCVSCGSWPEASARAWWSQWGEKLRAPSTAVNPEAAAKLDLQIDLAGRR